jgi:hypothetical protein
LALSRNLSPIPANVGDKTKGLSDKYCVVTGGYNSWPKPKKDTNSKQKTTIIFISL